MGWQKLVQHFPKHCGSGPLLVHFFPEPVQTCQIGSQAAVRDVKFATSQNHDARASEPVVKMDGVQLKSDCRSSLEDTIQSAIITDGQIAIGTDQELLDVAARSMSPSIAAAEPVKVKTAAFGFHPSDVDNHLFGRIETDGLPSPASGQGRFE